MTIFRSNSQPFFVLPWWLVLWSCHLEKRPIQLGPFKLLSWLTCCTSPSDLPSPQDFWRKVVKFHRHKRGKNLHFTAGNILHSCGAWEIYRSFMGQQQETLTSVGLGLLPFSVCVMRSGRLCQTFKMDSQKKFASTVVYFINNPCYQWFLAWGSNIFFQKEQGTSINTVIISSGSDRVSQASTLLW